MAKKINASYDVVIKYLDQIEAHLSLQNLILKEINNEKQITLPTETWVELYGVLSNYVLEYSSLDPITKIEPNGDEVYTEEKQDEYNHIVGDIEDILRTFFRKEDE
jgi:Trm5-related predicted tRNA methylase